MGEEKLDNAVYFIRGLYDFADMAKAKKKTADAKWANDLANKLRGEVRRHLVERGVDRSTRTRSRPAQQVQQKHWIGVTPMEAELTRNGARHARPRRRRERVNRAGRARERLLQRHRPAQPRPLPHRLRGRPGRQGRAIVYSLTNSIAAVAEGNYGRLGEEQQRRYTDANALPMLEPDEMPGALPEILPSPDQDANIGRCWTCRSMFMQAWGQYGIAWPVIHQQLGVRPVARHRQARDRAADPGGPEAHRRQGHPARRRRRGRRGERQRQPLHDDHDGRGDRGRHRRARRRDAPGGRGGELGDARRRAGQEADRARDQPRRRGDASRCPAPESTS